MIPELPLFISVIFAALTVTMLAFTVNGIRKTALLAGYSDESAGKMSLFTGLALSCWLILTAVLSLSDFYRDFTAIPPRFLTAVLPNVIAIFWLLFSKRTARLIAAIPQQWIVMLQVFRVVVEIEFYFLLINNAMPAIMTFEGRNFDIFVGLSAPIIGWLITKNKIGKRGLIVWNWAGILILASVIAHGILSVPSRFQMLITEPPNTFMTHIPFIWLPAFLAPFAMFLHGLSLRNLRLRKTA